MSRIEDIVCEKIQKRAEIGLKKYGVTVERTDFSVLDWLQYFQEELMDGIIYVERLMEELRRVEKAMPEEFKFLKKVSNEEK
jgi:hypothetical protein